MSAIKYTKFFDNRRKDSLVSEWLLLVKRYHSKSQPSASASLLERQEGGLRKKDTVSCEVRDTLNKCAFLHDMHKSSSLLCLDS